MDINRNAEDGKLTGYLKHKTITTRFQLFEINKFKDCRKQEKVIKVQVNINRGVSFVRNSH